MGLIRQLFGMGRAIKDVAEVFTVNKTREAEFQSMEYEASLTQFAAEFGQKRTGWFDGFVDGLNRLPRPVLALGTVGLFTFAMADPAAFSDRMRGLATVPVELWWLLGAIVSFYFGARELHYVRRGTRDVRQQAEPKGFLGDTGPQERNAALDDWRAARGN